jgi:hypothetical protein
MKVNEITYALLTKRLNEYRTKYGKAPDLVLLRKEEIEHLKSAFLQTTWHDTPKIDK